MRGRDGNNGRQSSGTDWQEEEKGAARMQKAELGPHIPNPKSGKLGFYLTASMMPSTAFEHG